VRAVFGPMIMFATFFMVIDGVLMAVFSQLPVAYPASPFEIIIPALDGKTPKMYRGGKICLSDHFKPLWGKNVPRYGIAHALALGLAPWLAAEIPFLVDSGVLSSPAPDPISLP